MGIHYLTIMGRDVENKKNLMQVRIMNRANMNSKNIVNNVGIFCGSAMNGSFNE